MDALLSLRGPLLVALSLAACAAAPSAPAQEPPLAAVAAPADAGHSSLTAPGMHRDLHLVVDGLDRTFDLYVPSSLGSGPAPLVFLLHGHGGSSRELSGADGKPQPFRVFLDLAERDGFLVVFPNGLVAADGKRGWNDGRADNVLNQEVDDVGFVSAILDEVSARFSVDPNRVHAAGISNGGHMVLRLATDLSERVASVAAVVGALPRHPEGEIPTRPVSVLFMNGTDDPFIPWEGGLVGGDPDRGTDLGGMQSARKWAEWLGADPNPTVTDLPNRNRFDGSRVRRHEWGNGRDGTRVVMYEVRGGGHATPSIREKRSWLWERIVGRQNHDVEGAEEIWAFFQATAR